MVIDALPDQCWYKVYRFDDMDGADREFDAEGAARKHFEWVLAQLREALPTGTIEKTAAA